MLTRWQDWKMTVAVIDETIDAETESFPLNIFAPEASMPKVEVGDVILLHSVKASCCFLSCRLALIV